MFKLDRIRLVRKQFLSSLRLGSQSQPSVRMSTFTLPDTNVSVSLVGDLTKDELLQFPGFRVRP